MEKDIKIYAYYLPQYYPIKENDEWWGKGFTEWTNVGRAKKWFPGHYQPHIPADLGYYDLRVPQVQEEQSEMALKYGIDGFIYWHYWFGNGRTIMDMPIHKMLENKNIRIPFGLCWANHSFFAKNWNSKDSQKSDRLLLEQKYLGAKDYEEYFKYNLKFFKDSRYIKIDNKPIFGLYQPYSMPDIDAFIDQWNNLARLEGFDGIYFYAFNSVFKNSEKAKQFKYDGIVADYLGSAFNPNNNFFKQSIISIKKHILHYPRVINYNTYCKHVIKSIEQKPEYIPCLLPNYDHSPRSNGAAMILHKSTPEKWERLLDNVFKQISEGKLQNNIIMIKAWNEWAEGNYLEPDLRYGLKYLEMIKSIREKYGL